MISEEGPFPPVDLFFFPRGLCIGKQNIRIKIGLGGKNSPKHRMVHCGGEGSRLSLMYGKVLAAGAPEFPPSTLHGQKRGRETMSPKKQQDLKIIAS